MEPNCYKCVYRGNVPGSVHSSCKHPAFEKALKSPLGQMMGIFASVGRIAPVQAESEVVVRGHPHGVRMGWFNHPWNFDPVWLRECTGFKAKEEPQNTP